MNSAELNSFMLYIHPPLAIIGFALAFLFAIFLFRKKSIRKRFTKLTGLSLWLFTFLGLTTGMIWAQIAWGSFWSWDPKEVMTLALFLSVSVGQTLYFEKKFAATKWVAVLTCVLIILTALSSLIITGLHSYT
jgi:ABC-type transport system involved in cytochrome c biogenesis permease subunit